MLALAVLEPSGFALGQIVPAPILFGVFAVVVLAHCVLAFGLIVLASWPRIREHRRRVSGLVACAIAFFVTPVAVAFATMNLSFQFGESGPIFHKPRLTDSTGPSYVVAWFAVAGVAYWLLERRGATPARRDSC